MKLTRERYYDLHTAFQRMIDTYGISNYSHFYPDLVLYYDASINAVSGEFDEQLEEISVNIAKCWDMESALKTMIHEYQHYLQPRNGWYDRHYKNGHSYDTHPYELKAEEIAIRDWRRFTPGRYMFTAE